MSVRRKAAFLLVFGPIATIGAAAFLKLAIDRWWNGGTGDAVLLSGVLLTALLWGGLSLRLRCPRCGYPALKRLTTAGGVTWRYWAPFPRACSRCGLDFRKDKAEPKSQG